MTDGTTETRRRRADAERNIAAILDAALTCLTRDADASIADIAHAAGVGRMTLYGHFSTRAELVDAVLARTVTNAEALLAEVELEGVPADEALDQLVRSTWRILAQFHSLHAAAQRELGAERIRQRHDHVLGRVLRLIERGQREGAFRAEVPAQWLVAVFHGIVHTAAEEVNAGRLDPADAGELLATTLLAAFCPPG